MCASKMIFLTIFSMKNKTSKKKTSDKYWFCWSISPLNAHFKSQETFTLILTWWSNKTSGIGSKATTWQTFSSLVCRPLKASDLTWIIVANYFNYALTRLPPAQPSAFHIWPPWMPQTESIWSNWFDPGQRKNIQRFLLQHLNSSLSLPVWRIT